MKLLAWPRAALLALTAAPLAIAAAGASAAAAPAVPAAAADTVFPSPAGPSAGASWTQTWDGTGSSLCGASTGQAAVALNQNLISNPGLEFTTADPGAPDNLSFADCWFAASLSASPDSLPLAWPWATENADWGSAVEATVAEPGKDALAALVGADSHAFQTIDVSSLGAGGQPYRLSASLGQGGHTNSTSLTVTFEDAAGNSLGTASVTDAADVAAGRFFSLPYSATGTVPPGTTQLLVSWGDNSATDTSGNDLADNLAFDIGPDIPPLALAATPVTFGTVSGVAGLYDPYGVAAADGTVYVSNTKDNVVESRSGTATSLVAGSFTRSGESGDGGQATSAGLDQPAGLALGSSGGLFIADSGDNTVREVTPGGIIRRVAGTGRAGRAGNGGRATAAQLDDPQDVAVNPAGDLLIADSGNNQVREVTPAGTIRVLAGNGRPGYAGDGGPAARAELSDPSGVAVDSAGNVYIADSANNVIRRVDARTGVITTVAGDYAADQAGGGAGGYSGDDGPATAARLDDPQAVALDPAGDLFIADTFNSQVREVTPGGTITSLAASPGPYGIAVDAVTGTVYVAGTTGSLIGALAAGAVTPAGPGPAGLAGTARVTDAAAHPAPARLAAGGGAAALAWPAAAAVLAAAAAAAAAARRRRARRRPGR